VLATPVRRLGTADAVVLGLAAMLGTGVFIVFAPAAAAAGGWLLLAVALAGVVATCNALSTAELAAAHPESGGGYVYGRERIGPWAGRLAGVAFLTGKTASAGAAAGAFGLYVLPANPWAAAVAAVIGVTALNMAGVQWTARGAWVLVSGVLAVLAVAVGVGLLQPVGDAGLPPAGPVTALGGLSDGIDARSGVLGVATAVGLIFFAFAGYARIATLGEEVRDPAVTIRRAIPLALAIALVVYLAVAAALLVGLGAQRLASDPTPLVTLVSGLSAPGLGVLVRLGAAVATVSVLLSVLVGISRTSLAMARRRELPAPLAVVGSRGTPWRADLLAAAVALAVAVLAGPVAAIALSACSVLVYYAVINAAALRLRPDERRWPRWTAWLGLALCLALAVLLPLQSVLITAGVLAVGFAVTTLLGRRSSRSG
jgi:APA family basic amino acid/polyamine antiporter